MKVVTSGGSSDPHSGLVTSRGASPGPARRGFRSWPLVVALVVLSACTRETPPVGALEMPLTVQGGDGARYRLAAFTITIDGPEHRVLHDDGRDVIRSVLSRGDYTITLGPDFSLYRTLPGASTEELVPLARAEDPMQSFSIAPSETTAVAFHFLADHGSDPTRPGNGVVEIGVRVRPVGRLRGTARVQSVVGDAALPLQGAVLDLEGSFVVRSRLDAIRGRGFSDSLVRLDEGTMSIVGDPTGLFEGELARAFDHLVVASGPPGERVFDSAVSPPPPASDASPSARAWLYADQGGPLVFRSSQHVLRVYPSEIVPPRLADGRLAALDFAIEASFELVYREGRPDQASLLGSLAMDVEVDFDPSLIPPTLDIVEPDLALAIDSESDTLVDFLGAASEPPAVVGWDKSGPGFSLPLFSGIFGKLQSDVVCAGIPEQNGVKVVDFHLRAAWGELHDNYLADDLGTLFNEEEADMAFPYDDYDYGLWVYTYAQCVD